MDDDASLGAEASGQSSQTLDRLGHLRAPLEDLGDQLRRRLGLVRAASGRKPSLETRGIETVPGEEVNSIGFILIGSSWTLAVKMQAF